MITLKEYLEASSRNPFYVNEPYEGQENDKNIIKEYNKALCEKYPWLIPTNKWSGKKITDCAAGEKGYWPGDRDSLPEYDYEYTELDEMPEGWRITFGEQMCEEIQTELEKFNYVNKYRIEQIKEKFGTLRWYDNGCPVGKLSDTYEIIKTDDFSALPHEDDDYYLYIGKDDDENYTMMYKHYKILDKCHLHDIIYKYEGLSKKYCINCGKPTKWESLGWISFYCDDCKKEMEPHGTEFVEIGEELNDN